MYLILNLAFSREVSDAILPNCWACLQPRHQIPRVPGISIPRTYPPGGNNQHNSLHAGLGWVTLRGGCSEGGWSQHELNHVL